MAAPPPISAASDNRPSYRSAGYPLLTALLLIACYWNTIAGMVHQWSTDQDMGHGFAVPFVATYIAWRERSKWLPHPEPSSSGLLLVAFAAALQYLASIGGGLFLGSLSFLLAIVGVLAVLGGATWLRGLAFPLLLLLFMLPKLAIVYNQVTLPLQLAASRLAEIMLSICGLPINREGNILIIGSLHLSVAEACSGVRYILSLSFLALVYAYFQDPRLWMRLALALVTIPVAIVANALRIAATGLAARFNPNLAEGAFHEFSGWLVFVLSIAAIIAGHRLLRRPSPNR